MLTSSFSALSRVGETAPQNDKVRGRACVVGFYFLPSVYPSVCAVCLFETRGCAARVMCDQQPLSGLMLPPDGNNNHGI